MEMIGKHVANSTHFIDYNNFVILVVWLFPVQTFVRQVCGVLYTVYI